MQQLENGLLYIFSMILQAILGLISSVFGILMGAFQSAVMMMVQASESLGPFSLPVFIIGTAVVICAGYLAFALAKDTPVVGALV
jgi:phosphotransferase system  glucose/maltose/N-acetylglucosamine-specific IIC component